VQSCTVAHTLLVSDDLHAKAAFNFNKQLVGTPVCTETEHELPQSGSYSVLASNCDLSLDTVTMSGSIVFWNPHGYLSAAEYPFLLYGGVFTIAFLALCIVWVSLMLYHRKTLSSVQFYVSLCLIFTVVDMVLLFRVLYTENQTGETSSFFYVCSAGAERDAPLHANGGDWRACDWHRAHVAEHCARN
jgi:hypothetical protein